MSIISISDVAVNPSAEFREYGLYLAAEKAAVKWADNLREYPRGLPPAELAALRAAVDADNPPSVGLSPPHICPYDFEAEKRQQRARGWARATGGKRARLERPARGPRVRIARGGEVVEVRGVRAADAARPGGGKRGRITGFSDGSRRRLMLLLKSVNRLVMSSLPLFLTLTYPAEWPEDSGRWHSDLDAWLGRLSGRYAGMSAVWRLEFQRRGAPHFHLLVFGVAWVDREWLARSWAAVVAGCRSCRLDGDRWRSGPACRCDAKHISAGTRPERVKSWRGVASYAAKYLSKRADGLGSEYIGRCWGVYNRSGLPIELVQAVLTFEQFYSLRRVLRRYLQGQGVTVSNRVPWRGVVAFVDWDVGRRLLEFMGVL